MLRYVTLADKDGNDVTIHDEDSATRQLTRASGLKGISPVRQNVRVRPLAHGGINRSRWNDAGLVVLEGEVFSAVDIDTAFSEFEEILKPMIDTLEQDQPTLLKWGEGEAGLELQKLVKLHDTVDPPLEGGEPSLTYQAQFYAEDPRAYTQTLYTATAPLGITGGGKGYPVGYQHGYGASSGGAMAIANDGIRETPFLIRLYGPCTDVTITLSGSTRQVVVDGTINDGDYLEIDGATRLLKINGVTDANNYLDAASTVWFDLPRGTSSLRTITTSFSGDAHIEVDYRHAH